MGFLSGFSKLGFVENCGLNEGEYNRIYNETRLLQIYFAMNLYKSIHDDAIVKQTYVTTPHIV